jgi:hypothetical protein
LRIAVADSSAFGRKPATGLAAIRVVLDEALHKVEAALLAQRDVDQEDVRSQRLGLAERFGAGRRDARDGQALSLEEHARGLEEGVVVVDDQQANRHSLSVAPTASQRITASRNPESSATGALGPH